MRPYDEIRTAQLRTALEERKKKACCAPCAKGGACAGTKSPEEKAEEDRTFIDRIVSKLTGKS